MQLNTSKQRGNQRNEVRKQKWECLESHTARRIFITRAITKGIPLNVIMGVTGHTRIETLTRYMVNPTSKSRLNRLKPDRIGHLMRQL